jgi:hypothetical protein
VSFEAFVSEVKAAYPKEFQFTFKKLANSYLADMYGLFVEYTPKNNLWVVGGNWTSGTEQPTLDKAKEAWKKHQ